ncbi:MAG: hypothetical protein AB8B73_01050 [Ekhidna sp.]
MSRNYQQAILLIIALGLYLFYFQFNEAIDFENCELCDAKQYKKVYDYFESGSEAQVAFPFYSRPLVPFLASIIPENRVTVAFHMVNLVFILLSVFTFKKLWNFLTIKPLFQWIGFGWLLTHWTGIIRYNLFDHLTVDVPLYFVQGLALLLFYQKKYKWFYLLTPLALLQKESFLAIAIMLLVIHIWYDKKDWFTEGKHLLFSLVFGVIIQKIALSLMPDQLDQRNSIMAILYHGKLAIDDPTRFVKWFAAFGSAFGVIPFIILFRIKSFNIKDSKELTLLIFSIMYCCFGLLAGEDMTRILFLGFPFIITLSLLFFQNQSTWLVLIAVALSAVSLHLYPLVIDNNWAVDYATMDFVYPWATYYLVAVIVFFVCFLVSRKRIVSQS